MANEYCMSYHFLLLSFHVLYVPPHDCKANENKNNDDGKVKKLYAFKEEQTCTTKNRNPGKEPIRIES